MGALPGTLAAAPVAMHMRGLLDISVPWWIGVPIIVFWVVVAAMIIRDDRDPARAITWLFVILILPVVGLFLFLLFGRDWKVISARRHRRQRTMAAILARMTPLYERNGAAGGRFAREYEDTAAESVSRLILRDNAAPVLPAASLEIFTAGADKFGRLEEDLAAAQRFIHLEYFIWQKDELTAKITAILLERLAAGVKVRILYDFLGAVHTGKSELKRLEAAGAEVSADVTSAFKLNYRNHRKIAVIDGGIGYTGGMNMGQEYIDGGRRFPLWRDTHVRITGQAVAELQKLFSIRWLEDEQEDILVDEYLPAPDGDGAGGILTQTVAHAVEDHWEAARRAHMVAIAGARRTLHIQSPYFVPDQAIYDNMLNAAQRGVELHFMMTGDRQVDKKLPFWAAQTYYRPLLESGARIYQYEAGFFHAKTIVVDGEFGAIGTMNMDIRSLRLHKELMLWIYDRPTAAQMLGTFEDDLRHCSEITLADLDAVPALIRFRNSVARLFSAQI